MDDRERLVLAYGIAEFATARDHFDALRRVGVRVPYSVKQGVDAILRSLCLTWTRTLPGKPAYTEEHVVKEARAYCTEHVSEIDDLTREEGHDQQDQVQGAAARRPEPWGL